MSFFCPVCVCMYKMAQYIVECVFGGGGGVVKHSPVFDVF